MKKEIPLGGNARRYSVLKNTKGDRIYETSGKQSVQTNFGIVSYRSVRILCVWRTRTREPYCFGRNDGGGYILVTDASALAAGDQVIIAYNLGDGKGNAMGAIGGTSTKYGTSVAVDITNDTITPGNDVKIVSLAAGTNSAWTLKTDEGYLSWSSGNSLTTSDTAYNWTIDIATDGTATITSVNTTERVLQYNTGTPRFACYKSTQKGVLIYKLTTTAGGGESGCTHTNIVAIGEEKDATCTETGITAGEKCADCDGIITAQQTIPALGHDYKVESTTPSTCTVQGTQTSKCSRCEDVKTENLPLDAHTYENGECTVCHQKQPTILTVNRDSFGDASGYAWHNWTATASTGETISGSGFIYGNTKDSIQMNAKTTGNGNYIYNTDPLPGKITSIKVTAFKTTYRGFVVLTDDTAFDSNVNNRLTSTEATVTVDQSGATWTFTSDHKYFAVVLADNGGAAYLSSIEIEYYVCPHTNKVAIGEAKDPDCIEDGITAGEKCADCGEITTPQETISATGHKDENADSKCDVCGANCCKEHSAGEWEEKTAASCTAAGERVKKCENCGEEMETEEISALGHDLQEGIITAATCTTAGEKAQVCQRENCEYKEGEAEIPATGHTWANGACQNCDATQGVYVKVTEDPADWSGSYLIVYEAGNIAFNGSLATLDAAGNGEAVTISNNLIIADNAINFTVAAVDDGYSIQSASGLYIGKTASGNGMNTNERTSYVNTFSVNSNGSIDIISSGGSILKYNNTSGQDRFRYYGSGQQEIALYKLVDEVDDFKKLTTEASFKLTYQKENNQYVKDENGHYVINTVKLRFGMTLDKDLSEKLLALGGTFNVEVAVGENEAFDCWNTGATPDWDNNKQKYMLAVVIGVPQENWSDILTAKMYVKIGDTKYYMGKAEYSVNSLAEKYLLTETDAETVFTLNTLAGKAITEVE